MKNHQKAIYWMGAIFLCIILLVLLTIANYQFSKNNPGGTDFLVHWVGTRAYFGEGISPYSDQVALEIQQMVYGRAALPGEHELRVAYPILFGNSLLPIRNYPGFRCCSGSMDDDFGDRVDILNPGQHPINYLAPKELGSSTIVIFLTSLVPRSALIDQW